MYADILCTYFSNVILNIKFPISASGFQGFLSVLQLQAV